MLTKNRNKRILQISIGLIMLLGPLTAAAHDVVSELEDMSNNESALFYLELGFRHIVPSGLDHILFVLSLFLLSPRLRPILWQSLAFTIAHSITLGLAMFNVIAPAANLVEPLIALSIVYVAVENIFTSSLRSSRIVVVFCFGLIHGLGFAGSLSELGLPSRSYLSSLLMFNVGVEMGQLAVILAAWFLIGKWFNNRLWYHKRIVVTLSLSIAAVALYWIIERTVL
jgi:hypothetical protein